MRGLLPLGDVQLDVEMIRSGCGIILTNNSKRICQTAVKSDCISPNSLQNLIKEFGVVVLRGFDIFTDEQSLLQYYKSRASYGLMRWNFGMLKKVVPDKETPGFVNSKESLPIHFDFSNPPSYMGIKQSEHHYEDYVCREFLLYCRTSVKNEEEDGTRFPKEQKEEAAAPSTGIAEAAATSSKTHAGATTFVDAHGAGQALCGIVKQRWKKILLAYETELATASTKKVYFGGKGNPFEYPLVLVCPWTGKDVLRWGQSWTKDDHPHASQYIWVTVKSAARGEAVPELAALESQIKKAAFDKRFFFSHDYKEGDQVYVNNYTMLHGRNGFPSNRELWRLQAAPPSANLPAYLAAKTEI